MKVLRDSIVGDVKVGDEVLLELLDSESLNRLKGITQSGIPDRYSNYESYDRYEHSVGVLLLLKKLGADLEEQVAGLLHDVSHLAFSHLAEWVFAKDGDMSETFSESLTKKFILESELAAILKKHDYSIDRITDFDNFPLLKRPAPDLNADRLDYVLRETALYFDAGFPDRVIPHVIEHDSTLVFGNEKAAEDFSLAFLRLQQEYWGSFDSLVRYFLFSQVLKRMVNLKLLALEDFFGSEEAILMKLYEQNDRKIVEFMEVLEQKDLEKYRGTFGQTIHKKFRYVDPLIKQKEKLTRLSEMNVGYKQSLKTAREENSKGMEI